VFDFDPPSLLAADVVAAMKQFVDFVLHIDDVLFDLVKQYGVLTYLILFFIIFCETGLVVTPILPGDSLLFAAGAVAGAQGGLELPHLLVLLTIAAVLGDAVNYSVGFYLGPKVLTGKRRFLKREYLDRTQDFFRKHGKKTIILARFVPIVRTFAPFLAGVGRMSYWEFGSYNVIGGILWICLCTVAGYLFGNIQVVREYFEVVIIGIVVASIMPAVFEIWRSRRSEKQASSTTEVAPESPSS
jgi:membrane-associated protein